MMSVRFGRIGGDYTFEFLAFPPKNENTRCTFPPLPMTLSVFSKKMTLAVGVLLLAGCTQQVSEKIMEDAMEKSNGGEAKVDMKADGSMEIETDEGTFTTGDDVPADWPEDAPIYTNAKVSYAATMNPTTGESGNAIVLMTTDSVADVVAFYKEEISNYGWTMGEGMQGGGTEILSATKDDRVLSIIIAGSNGQTAITIGVSQAK